MSKERSEHNTSFKAKMDIKSGETVAQRASPHDVYAGQTQS